MTTALVVRREIRRDLISPSIRRGFNATARTDVVAGNSKISLWPDGHTSPIPGEVTTKNNKAGEVALVNSRDGLFGLPL